MEPLSTDEKLAKPAKPERDMDSQMILGCSGFVTASFATYFLSIWPFLVWLDVYQFTRVLVLLALGIIPAFLVGWFATAKFEIAGAAGFVGGILASAIFIYLRFEQTFLEAEARRFPFPDYPRAIQWTAPLGIILAAILLVGLVLVFQKPGRESSPKR